jgi:hypothetical protein
MLCVSPHMWLPAHVRTKFNQANQDYSPHNICIHYLKEQCHANQDSPRPTRHNVCIHYLKEQCHAMQDSPHPTRHNILVCIHYLKEQCHAIQDYSNRSTPQAITA